MAKSLLYQNDQSGYLGLGPYTTDGGDERTDSFMYQLHQEGRISKNIATYNITFNPNATTGSDSYVQLGDISQYVKEKLTWMPAMDWDYFKSPVSHSYIMANGDKLFPFVQYNASAIFDPEVDYMYVNLFEFDYFIQPVLQQIYGNINCTENYCYFNFGCDMVSK